MHKVEQTIKGNGVVRLSNLPEQGPDVPARFSVTLSGRFASVHLILESRDHGRPEYVRLPFGRSHDREFEHGDAIYEPPRMPGAEQTVMFTGGCKGRVAEIRATVRQEWPDEIKVVVEAE
jgi:hypothetical protein